MGWGWDDFTDAVDDAVDSVTDVIDEGAEAISEGASDVVDSIGAALNNIFDAMGLDWLGWIINSVFIFIGGIIKGIISIVAGAITGTIKIFGGIISLNGGLILDGFEDIGASIWGAVTIIVGDFIQLVQAIFGVTPRQLNEYEKEILKRVFTGSLSVYVMRILEGNAGLFSLNPRPFTLGNVIYFKDHKTSSEPGLFVHESVHAWQYQHLGVKYSANAVWAQWTSDAYNWIHFYVDENITDWEYLNKESQAEAFKDIYDWGEMICKQVTTMGNGVFFDAEKNKCANRLFLQNFDFTKFANEAVDYVQNKTSFRWVSQNVD